MHITTMNDSPSTDSSSIIPTPAELPSQSHAVSAVSLKLPPYWPNDPAVWFAQVEAQFLTRNITAQDTKFAYVVSTLGQDIAQEIRDLIIAPPTDQQYDKLKTELIKRTALSDKARLNQLLMTETLGDRKPSQLLRKMRQLLGDRPLEDGILRQLFLQRLPTNVQLILASTSDTVSTDDLASLADKILEVAPPQHSIAAITAKPAQNAATTTKNEIQDLRNQLATLTTQLQSVVNQLQISPPQSRSRGRSPTPARSPSRPRSGATPPTTHAYCWYHFRFGASARKCNPPCAFTTSATPTSQNQENYQASD